MSRGPDASTLLERALIRSSRQAGCPVEIIESDWERWASATFTGARHQLTFTAPDSDGFRSWLSELPEAEFSLQRHLLADLNVTECAVASHMARVRIEALTVEDR